jgi:hypothetical protein
MGTNYDTDKMIWKWSVQRLINEHGLTNFPRLNNYLGGGSFGAIFTTTNSGKVLKITPGNASFEFNALKRLKNTGFVPQAYQKAVVTFNTKGQKKKSCAIFLLMLQIQTVRHCMS